MYEKWSSGIPEEYALVVYDSMWHTTEAMATEITEAFIEMGIPARLLDLKAVSYTHLDVYKRQAIDYGPGTFQIFHCFLPGPLICHGGPAGLPLAERENERIQAPTQALLGRVVQRVGIAAQRVQPPHLPTQGVVADVVEQDGLGRHGVERLAPGYRCLLYTSEALQGMLDKFGVDSRWDAEVTNLLIEDGAVVGVRYESGSIVTDVRASNVIIATGGFIQNEDMLRDYYSGSVMYGTGNQYNDGAGIRLAQSAGAQMGKNFSTSINESGACNMKSADRFVSLSDCNDTPVFSLPLFGGLMVNKHGSRFMDEGTMAKHTMYCGEPLLREGVYYMVIDDGLIDELATTPIMDFISEDAFGNMAPGVQMGFMDKTLTALPEKVQQGIDEGWIWKADSAEALAEACGCLLYTSLAPCLGHGVGLSQLGPKAGQFQAPVAISLTPLGEPVSL